MTKTAQTRAAREAARVSFARRRFDRWATEMREWGCQVVLPTTLTPPDGKREAVRSDYR